MTKPLISSHDNELLSAYIDGQLTAHQRAALEARLQTQPTLKTELEALQKTRHLLRSLPPLRAPRNFTLSTKTYRRYAQSRVPSLFGAISALSSAMLIMLVISSILFDRSAQPVSMAEESLAYPVELEASAPEGDIALSMQQKALDETEAAGSYATSVSDDVSRFAEPTLEALTAPPAAQESMLVLEPTPTPPLEEGLALGVQEAETPTEFQSQPTQVPSPTPLPYEVALPGIMSGGDNSREGETAKIPEATPLAHTSPMPTTLLLGEITLAVIALISGLIALVLLIRLRR